MFEVFSYISGFFYAFIVVGNTFFSLVKVYVFFTSIFVLRIRIK